MEIRSAAAADLPAAVRLYAEVIDAMRGTPRDIEWDLSWHPAPADLAAAAEAGELFVAPSAPAPEPVPGPWPASDRGFASGSGSAPERGEPALDGAFVLNGSQAAAYAEVAWGVPAAPDEVAVLHLLAVSPRARGRGVGRALVAEAARRAREAGARALRLDVLANNAPAVALYRSCGFTDLGARDLEVAEGFSRPAHPMELALA